MKHKLRKYDIYLHFKQLYTDQYLLITIHLTHLYFIIQDSPYINESTDSEKKKTLKVLILQCYISLRLNIILYMYINIINPSRS